MTEELQEEPKPPFRASDSFFVCLGMTGEPEGGESIDRQQTPKSWGRRVRICVTTGLFIPKTKHLTQDSTDAALKLPGQQGKER